MHIFNSGNSPYMILWYMFLAFFAIVIIANVLALIGRFFISWQIERLLRKDHTAQQKAAK